MNVIRTYPTKAAVAGAAATRLTDIVTEIQAGRPGDVHLALTGGSLGSAVWEAVPTDTAVDWGRVQVWWSDERYLPTGDPDRNDVQNDAAGLAGLGLDPAKVHRIPGPDECDSAEAAATAYESELRSTGAGAFDLTLLGVGPDGHVASLFPGHPDQLRENAIAVAVHDSPKPPPTRVSLTLEALARSDRVWFLVSGADKAGAVAGGVARANPDVSTAAQVQGRLETLWLIDSPAAARLTKVRAQA